MESASATAPQEHILTTKTESARAALPTASVASPTPSATLVTLDTTLPTEFVSLPRLPAQQDNTDTTVCAILNAQLVPAPKETSVRELAQLEPGSTTEDATETVLPVSLLLMLASPLALQELPLQTEFVKSVLKPVPQVNIETPTLPAAKLVNILVASALSLLLTALNVLLA